MFRKTIEFTLFGSIFLSLCTVCMCVETNLLLNLPLNNFSFYSFVFGATLVQYNLHYLIKKPFVHQTQRFKWIKSNNLSYKLLVAIGLVLMIISLFSFHPDHYILLLLIGIITIVYSFPLLPFKNRKRIKDFGVLKIITLVLAWALVTAWLPVYRFAYPKLLFQLIFIERFFFLFTLCLLFDIRDIETDRSENIRTIPVLAGIKSTYFIIYLFLTGFIISAFAFYLHYPDFRFLNAMLLSALSTLLMIELSRKKKPDMFYLICVDGMMLLQALLVIIGSL